MRILVISTSVFTLPPKGYSGLEALCFQWACLFAQAGHKVTVVCPKGGWFPEGIEIIETELREAEEQSYQRYKDRLLAGDWDAVFDNSWLWFTVLAQAETEKQLPVLHMYHSDPLNLGSPPPIQYPLLVSPSRAQANIIANKWKFPVRIVPHGIDVQLYKPDPNVERTDRYLWLARYTPEKGFKELANIARKCNVGLDAYGDLEIIASQDYANQCFKESDGKQIIVNKGISREETVKQYQSHKALLLWTNYVEIWGLTTTEAMACGCPVIARNTGAAPEQIIHGKTGFLCDTLDEMESIIREDRVSSINPDDCVERAKEFSIENSARGHLRLLEEIANGVRW